MVVEVEEGEVGEEDKNTMEERKIVVGVLGVKFE